MKKVLLILALLCSYTFIFSQMPSHFKYQGVARDIDDQAYENTDLGIKISIVEDNGAGTGSGIVRFVEKHLVATSPLGVFSLNIGNGQITFGDFEAINWSQGAFWLKVEMDVEGGEDYIFMGNSPILPVPIAIHAMTVDDKNDADADPENELQTLVFNANTNALSLTNGGEVDLSTLQGGNGGTDDQTLQLNGNLLSIEGGNQIDLTTILDGTEDADANPTNELQNITFNPNTNELSISQGNTIAIPAGQADADADPQNELQTLNFNENTNTLSLSDGGEVDLSTLEGGTGNDEQTLTLNGTTLSIENGNQVDLGLIQDGIEDADANPENELQTISFDVNSNELTISQGNTIAIPAGQADADADPQNELQSISLNGTTLNLSDGGGEIDLATIQDGTQDADADPNNELQSIAFDANSNTLSLTNGGQVDLTSLAGGGGSDNQNLQLNGTILSIENANQIDLAAIQDGTQDADADPNNEIQNLQLNGTTLSIENGNQVNLAAIQDGTQDADANPNNEIQNLQLNGTTLSIENGNQVNLAAIQDGTQDADADPNNEIQSISFNSNTNELSISDGNTINIPLDVDDNDHSPTNELQTLSLNGNNLSLTNGGQVDLSGLGGSSLWSQSPSQLYTNEDVGIGLESDHFATLEVKENLLIRNTAGNTSAYLFSTSEGGHLLLKKGNQTGITGTGTLDLTSQANGGAIFLRNSNGNIRSEFQLNSFSGGEINLLNSLNNKTVRFNTSASNASLDVRQPDGSNGSYVFANNTGGFASFYGASAGITPVASIGRNGSSTSTGSVKVGLSSNTGLTHMYVTSADQGGNRSGIIDGFSTEGGRVFRLSSYSDSRTRGVMAIYNDDGDPVAYVTGQDGGEFILQANSANRNVYLGTSANSAALGKISVYDSFNDESAGFFTDGFGNGTVWADIKNFRMDHPTDDTKEIWYASIEGSEAAAYQRGTANLVDGEVIVSFPEHFQFVANHETMTVLLTPLSADCKGLAVIEKTATGFKVKELFRGTGTYQFDWEVKCVRKGYENYKTIREKKDRL